MSRKNYEKQQGLTDAELYRKVVAEILASDPPKLLPLAKDVYDQTFVIDPAERPTMQQIVDSPAF